MWRKSKGRLMASHPSILCVLQRNIASSLRVQHHTFVRPIAEYASSSCSPPRLLNHLINWSSLQERRQLSDLSLFYRWTCHTLVCMPLPSDMDVYSSCTRRSHNLIFRHPQSFVKPYKYSSFFLSWYTRSEQSLVTIQTVVLMLSTTWIYTTTLTVHLISITQLYYSYSAIITLLVGNLRVLQCKYFGLRPANISELIWMRLGCGLLLDAIKSWGEGEGGIISEVSSSFLWVRA